MEGMNRREWLLGVGAVGAAAYSSRLFGAEASRRIHLDQAGYLPGERKLATVVVSGESFTAKRVRDGQVVLRGKTGAVIHDELSGDRVQLVDWSEVRDAGEYVIEAGGESSLPVHVGESVRRDALRSAMRSYYGQRCGCAVDMGG